MEELERGEAEKQTAMDFWLPAVEAAGLRYPRTSIIEASRVGFKTVCQWYDGFCCEDDQKVEAMALWCKAVDAVTKAAVAMGFPCFIRTAYTSGKHDWDKTCYNDDLAKISTRLARLVEDTLLKDIDLGFFAVREFLPLRSSFHAFWGNMPVAREFRFFAEPDRIRHVQPYWPPGSIRNPSIEGWEPELEALSRLDDATREELSQAALRVVDALGGYWSVDFAQHENGDWYLIDMARGEVSFFWPGAWDGERFVEEG